MLAQAVGLSRRDAAGQVKTAKQLEELPSVRDAVQNGDISVANAKVLAGTCEKTSFEQVARDEELLAKAAVLSPEQLAREAGRWAAARQPGDGEELYRRQRARRRLSIFDGDDGMVLVRGELDPVTGAKVRKRFLLEAERLRRLDLHSPGADRRSFNQRMADALDTLTSHGSIYAKAGGESQTAPGANSPANVKGAQSGKCGCGSKPSADITIVQHLDAAGTRAFAEIVGGGVIPQSVLEEHFCNAAIKGVVFSSEGVPLWHGHTKRRPTKAQMNALRARYGACGGCGADMWICDGHHVEPVSRGGSTDIDNMMLLCWVCHQKVHRHGWREVPDGRGLYTIAPPERIRHGPAHAPDPPPDHGPSPPQRSRQPDPPPDHGPGPPQRSRQPDPPPDHEPSPPRRSRQPKPSSMGRPVPDPVDPAAPPQPEPLFG